MVEKKQISSLRRLGVKAFPAHQLERSSQYAFRGGIITLYLAPLVISVFRSNDSSSVGARPGFAFLFVASLVWTVVWLASFVKYRGLVQATYDEALLVPGSTRRYNLASRAKWILSWLAATSWAAMILTANTTQLHPNTLILSPWSVAVFVLTGIGALVLVVILSEHPTGIASSEAFQLEKDRGIQYELQMQEATLREKTDSIAESLGERISRRIDDLERLSLQVDSTRRTRELIQREVDAEMQELNRKIYGMSARKDRRRQWGFVFLSFVLGFVVNGLTAPVVDLVRGIHL